MILDVDVELPDGTLVHAGRVEDRPAGRASVPAFQYSAEYLTLPAAYSLSPSLPLLSGWFTTPPGRGMVAGLADSQPDAWGRTLMRADRAARARQAREIPTPPTEVDVLAAVPDVTRMGALRFRDADGYVGVGGDVASIVDIPALIAAVEAFADGAEYDSNLRRLVAAGTSVGGARPKATVRREDGTLAIAKFRRDEDLANIVEWEAVGLRLATQAGIEVPPFRIIGPQGSTVLLVDRFDRGPDGARIGYISADSLLGRVQGEETTYVDFADHIALHTSKRTDLEHLFRRIALTLLVNNVDDHMRNHGLLRDRDGWSLSPAFDINPHKWVGDVSSTPISDRDDPANRDIRLLAEESDVFGMSRDRANQVIAEVERATANWREVALGFGIAPEAADATARAFMNANRDRAQQIAGDI